MHLALHPGIEGQVQEPNCDGSVSKQCSAFLQSSQHMMAQSMPFIIAVAALIVNSLSYCSAENVYCVTPTATSCSSCPQNSTHCATLSEYAQNAELYFTSDTTMVFLSAAHTLNTDITVANVTRLTMRGESLSNNRATVVCNGSVDLSFIRMVEFKICSIAFTSCNRKHGTPPSSNYALLLESTQSAALINCSFHDNTGTALVVRNTNVTLAGNSEFTHNQYHCKFTSCAGGGGGGGITALSSSLKFTGNTTFLENAKIEQGGGAIYASGNAMLSFHGTTNFINNSVHYGNACGGAICAVFNTVFSFIGTSNFILNSAMLGGAISAQHTAVFSFIGTTNFISNSADYYGTGGAIFTANNTMFSFTGVSNFINNSADYYYGNGGAIGAYNTVLSFSGTINFINNSATNRGGAICLAANSTLVFNGTININCNKVGTGLLSGDTVGGGVYIGLKSTFTILPKTTMYWENNNATLGGAIYVVDASPFSYCTLIVTQEECFFQLPGQNLSSGIDIQLVFKNNSAVLAGSVLYGGTIDNCKLTGLAMDTSSSGEVFDVLIHTNDSYDNTTSNISSDPLHICTCENNLPVCSKSEYGQYTSIGAHPGEKFQISVIAVGQRDGAVPSTLISTVKDNKLGSHLQDYQYLQQVNNTCTKLNYTVFSLSQSMEIELQAEGNPCSKFDYTYMITYGLMLHVALNQTCPPGFNISESERACVCEPRLAQYTGTHQCHIANGLGQITRNFCQHFWVGYDHHFRGLIINPHCPFDYCVNKTVVFPLNNTDIQCAYTLQKQIGCFNH